MTRALLLLASVVACGGERRQALPDTPPRAAEIGPADSMVAKAGPYSLWFTLARPATDSVGTACTERGLEIRTGSQRRLVPLLYTREAPMVENDTSVLVHLSDHCGRGALYRVNLRSAQPTPVR